MCAFFGLFQKVFNTYSIFSSWSTCPSIPISVFALVSNTVSDAYKNEGLKIWSRLKNRHTISGSWPFTTFSNMLSFHIPQTMTKLPLYQIQWPFYYSKTMSLVDPSHFLLMACLLPSNLSGASLCRRSHTKYFNTVRVLLKSAQYTPWLYVLQFSLKIASTLICVSIQSSWWLDRPHLLWVIKARVST